MEEKAKNTAMLYQNTLLDSNSLWLRDCLSTEWSLYNFSLWVVRLLFWTSIFFWHPKHPLARNTKNVTLQYVTMSSCFESDSYYLIWFPLFLVLEKRKNKSVFPFSMVLVICQISTICTLSFFYPIWSFLIGLADFQKLLWSSSLKLLQLGCTFILMAD